MTGSVTVLGSANVDHIVGVPRLPAPGETVAGADPVTAAGGKGLNQAVASARQNCPTTFVGTVGDDDGGVLIRRLLTNERIDTRWLRTVARPTGSAVVLVDDSCGENSIVVSPGANAHTSEESTRVLDGLAATSADVLLLQLEVPLPAVVAAAQRWNGTVILNPAPAGAIPVDLWQATDIVVLNQSELDWFVPGGTADVFAAMAELPVRQAITTLGADGCAVLSSDGSTTLIRPPRVDAVDTTGAGDTFCGVLAAGVASGEPLAAAAQQATIAAAMSTLKVGAQGGPRRDDLDASGLRCVSVAVR